MSPNTQIALFRGKQIRKTLHNDEWRFAVQDVVAALIDSADPQQYVKRMRARDPQLNKGWVQLVPPLLIETAGHGRARKELEGRTGRKVVNSQNYLPERAPKRLTTKKG